MSECQICGGVNTCPKDWYHEVREMPQDAIKEIPVRKPIPDGGKATHLKGRRRIICKLEPLPGYELELVGRAQAHRIYAHYHVAGVWVGQCTYAFCVRRTGNLPPSGHVYAESDIMRALDELHDSDEDEAIRTVLRNVEREHQAEARREARRMMSEAARVNGGVRRRILADIDAV